MEAESEPVDEVQVGQAVAVELLDVVRERGVVVCRALLVRSGRQGEVRVRVEK